MSHPELEFFNSLSGELKIELTVPPEQVADLLNLQAKPEAEVVQVTLEIEFYDPQSDDFRDLTEEELQSIAFRVAGPR